MKQTIQIEGKYKEEETTEKIQSKKKKYLYVKTIMEFLIVEVEAC